MNDKTAYIPACAQKIKKPVLGDNGDAVVEATILFPIMIMIFAGLVLLAIYMPTRAALQRVTQYAATAIAVEISDTWLFFDEGSMSYYWETDKNNLPGIYAVLLSDHDEAETKGENIATIIDSRSISAKSGSLEVDCTVINHYLYKEVVVVASREFFIPVNLSFIGFPETIKITVSSTAVVNNGEEYVRNMDLAVDFTKFIKEKYGLSDAADTIAGYRQTTDAFYSSE